MRIVPDHHHHACGGSCESRAEESKESDAGEAAALKRDERVPTLHPPFRHMIIRQ